ncbi:MAG: TonB-dependent receptor [Opitutaceae bacterium]|nr:TonB-dependent receptor [Opitutaceae bacterium]
MNPWAPSYIKPVFNNGANSYRFIVDDSISFNANISYRFMRNDSWLNDTTVRLGVVNLTDETPPLTSDSRGYETGVYNLMARGRTLFAPDYQAVLTEDASHKLQAGSPRGRLFIWEGKEFPPSVSCLRRLHWCAAGPHNPRACRRV